MPSIELYQGTGKAFSRYDVSMIGTGDNTAFFAKGHHFSPSISVAEFYAKRTAGNDPGYLYTVKVNANLLHVNKQSHYTSLVNAVSEFYPNDIFDDLVGDIMDKTEYSASNEQAEELAVALLTDNEYSDKAVELIEDINYNGWDGFQMEHKGSLHKTLSIPLEYEMYVDVGSCFYHSTLHKNDENYANAHKDLIRMGIDGLHYDNFGNNAEEATNTVVWNDSAITIINMERRFEPDPPSARLRR